MGRASIGAAIGLAGAFALSPAPALAGKATYTMPVSVNVVAGCTVTALPLVFMMPVPANANFDSTTTITVKCSPNMAYTIDLDEGLHAQGNNRRVRHATSATFIRYDLYQNSPRSKVWGRGNTRNLAGNAGPTGTVVYSVYGRLAGRTGLPAGNFSDLVTVTVNF